MSGTVSIKNYGVTDDGQQVFLFTLDNGRGMTVRITNYGGIITELWVPDRQGRPEDIVLGFPLFQPYLENKPYFGCLIGRYANRIARGCLTLDHTTYSLAINNGENHLHGGIKGFNRVVWTATPLQAERETGLQLQYQSRDMEEGYPGNLWVTVTYSLTETNELKINYLANTDKTTVCNLTQHNYYNLAGVKSTSILSHLLKIHGQYFTPINPSLIPTGEILPVADTPLDFTSMTAIGARIHEPHPQLIRGNGYDHNWVLDKTEGPLSLAAEVRDPLSGRIMTLYTSEPGLQLYTGNFLDSSLTGKNHLPCQPHQGFCLETQHFPNSPNTPHFPSTTLHPGETYLSTSIFKFGTE